MDIRCHLIIRYIYIYIYLDIKLLSRENSIKSRSFERRYRSNTVRRYLFPRWNTISRLIGVNIFHRFHILFIEHGTEGKEGRFEETDQRDRKNKEGFRKRSTGLINRVTE